MAIKRALEESPLRRVLLLALLTGVAHCAAGSSHRLIEAEPWEPGIEDPSRVRVLYLVELARTHDEWRKDWVPVADLYAETSGQWGTWDQVKGRLVEELRVRAARMGGQAILVERIGAHPLHESRSARTRHDPNYTVYSHGRYVHIQTSATSGWLASARAKALRPTRE